MELLKKLAQVKVDTTLLQSSKKLGIGRESKREVLSRALRERDAGLNPELNDETLLEERRVPDAGAVEESETKLEAGQTGSTKFTQQESHSSECERHDITIGSGLKRPLEVGIDGNPVIPRRKKRKVAVIQIFDDDVESTWEGFNSETEPANTGRAPSERGSEIDSADALKTGGLGDLSELSDSAESDSSSQRSSLYDDEGDNTLPCSTRKERISAFKAWANQQRNEVLGFQTSAPLVFDNDLTTNFLKPSSFQPRKPEADPLLSELEIKPSNRKAFSVHVDRSPEVLASRLALPVVREEQRIMEAIHNNPITVLCGETGSGKTTQIPQFLYEAGYGSPETPTPGMIGITQSRRVAAVSMAKRVGDELEGHADRVAYKVRQISRT